MKNIYIIHGWTYFLDKWQPLITLLRKNSFNPIQLKIPGLTTQLDQAWTISDYVEWLHSNIAKEKNKVILIGHSNGGRIALNFALKYPDKTKQLVLIDSGGIYDDGLSISLKRYIFKFISSLGKFFTRSEKLRRFLYKIIGESDYKDATPLMRQTMINLLKSDQSLKFDQISVPTTIIWGQQDTITPLSHARQLHRLILKSQLYIIEGARHASFFTHPEKVTQIIINAINRI